MKRSSTLILLCAIFLQLPTAAKDGVSLCVQAGAVGQEKTFTYASSLSSGSVTVPYTETTFDPCFHVGIDVPMADVSARTFFNIKAGYDFSWEGRYTAPNSDSSLEESSYKLFHTISLLPELTFAKDGLRLFVGTGLAFDIMNYSYDTRDDSYYSTSCYTIYQFFWTTEIGAKYYFMPHFAVIFDLTFSLSCLKSRRNGEYTMKENGSIFAGGTYSDYTNEGNEPLLFRPRLGLCYTF